MAKVTTRSWGPGTSALVRALIAATGPLTQTELAALVGVTQPRVSQVLAQLGERAAVTSFGNGYVARPQELLDLYVAHHRPAVIGHEVPWYGLQPLREQVRQIIDLASITSTRVAVSADVGPDLLAPWRHPTVTVVYADAPLELSGSAFVAAEGRVDASVLVRHTRDTTLLAPFEPWPRDAEAIPLTDPVQQVWDLHNLGGQDRVEAANRLAEQIIDRRFGRAT